MKILKLSRFVWVDRTSGQIFAYEHSKCCFNDCLFAMKKAQQCIKLCVLKFVCDNCLRFGRKVTLIEYKNKDNFSNCCCEYIKD